MSKQSNKVSRQVDKEKVRERECVCVKEREKSVCDRERNKNLQKSNSGVPGKWVTKNYFTNFELGTVFYLCFSHEIIAQSAFC